MSDEPNGTELQFPRIPSLARRIPARTTCGDCAYFQFNPGELTTGYCHGNPPAAILMNSPQGPVPAGLRPPLAAKDISCRHFSPRK